MLSKNLKFSVLAAGLLFSINAMADTGFKVPVHYNVELVDGEINYLYLMMDRILW